MFITTHFGRSRCKQFAFKMRWLTAEPVSSRGKASPRLLTPRGVLVKDACNVLQVHTILVPYNVGAILPLALRAQELCESRDGRPGLPSLISLRFLWTKSNTQPTTCESDAPVSIACLMNLFVNDESAVYLRRASCLSVCEYTAFLS